MQDDVVALFAYDRWANTKVLDACRKLTAEQYVAEPVPGWSSVRCVIPASVHEPFWGILYPGFLRILGGWPWVEGSVARCRGSWHGPVIGYGRGVEHAVQGRGSPSRCGRWPLS